MTTTALRMVGTLLMLAGLAVLVGAIPLPGPGDTAPSSAVNTAPEARSPAAEPDTVAETSQAGDETAGAPQSTREDIPSEAEASTSPDDDLGATVSCDEEVGCEAAAFDQDDEAVGTEALETAAVELETAGDCDGDDDCDWEVDCELDSSCDE